MININTYEVSRTYNMIEYERLDARIITLGISLLECMNSSLEALSEKVYKKITILAKNLISTGRDVEAGFDIPTTDKRISATPTVLVGGSACRRPEDLVTITKILDIATKEAGINLTDGYSALVNKGMTRTDKSPILSIPQALSQTGCVCSSINVGSTKTGIDVDTMELMGRIVIETAKATRGHDSLGCAKLVIFCDIPGDNPFMAGAFHGVAEFEAVISVGVGSPDVVKVALARVGDTNFEVLRGAIKKTASKITRVDQPVAQKVSRRMGIPFGIIDLPLVPTFPVEDSVTETLEEVGLERVDAPGITVTLAMLNNQVKKGGIMASPYVGGLNGTFTPVSEGQGMIDTISMGALTIEKLEAITYVYSVGLDMITIPGDMPSNTIAGTIAGEVAIGAVNQEMTAVRLIPVVGKKVRETAEFGELLSYAPIMPVNIFSCKRFITRGGRILIPIHSFKD